MPSQRRLPGQAENPEDNKYPDKVDPVPEKVAGTVFPYRGMEQHGVKQPEDMPIQETGQYHLGEDEFYTTEGLEAEKEPEPVPVKVVNTGARTRKMYRMYRHFSNDTVSTLANRRDGRTRLLVRSRGSNTGTAWLAHDRSQATASMGWGLATGNELEMLTTEAVYVLSETGETQDLFVLEEYEIEL